ncbi:MAG: helix-turn-helix domain-containing protein [Accumulibacter sp.]|jgi:hypothetical protein|uniref:helix-turn-helix domain-containing protein n=1 Tax=Accumulibacter sp. TaxID=2053492 RepID=UPI002FC3D264
MITALSMRLHHLIDDVEAHSLRSGRQRIVAYLLRHAEEGHGGAVTVALPTNKRIIASCLKMTQETLSRPLQSLGKQACCWKAGWRSMALERAGSCGTLAKRRACGSATRRRTKKSCSP